MKIVNTRTDNLFIDNFFTEPSQAWCIIGNNRSGIDAFFSLISGGIAPEESECLILPQKPGVVSFKGQQFLFEEELKKDDTDFMDRIDPGTIASSFIKNPDQHGDLIRAFQMGNSMDKGYRQLSSGQSRKLMLLSQISLGADCLLVQSPYEGLDQVSCEELDRAFSICSKLGVEILITVYNREDIPDWCTHVGVIASDRMVHGGPRAAVAAFIELLLLKEAPGFSLSAEAFINPVQETNKSGGGLPVELVSLKDGTAGYGGMTVFSNIDLRINACDHTLISGPNGCGKSTLLQVLTGDHPACYTNDLSIFGIKRGSGESIWELKKHMGIVSSDLHRNYLVAGSVLHCIMSGLFDSIGLYTPYTAADEDKARELLDRTGLSCEADTPFRNLTYADQRLALIARALIKCPKLLILDEPTQGLDEPNRLAVLDFLEQIADEKLCTIVYVSHRRDEFRSFFKNHIRMEPMSVKIIDRNN